MSSKPSLKTVFRTTRLTPPVGRECKRAIPVTVPRRVLVLAPHADDELLSCGGTILKYAEWGVEVIVLVATSGLGGTSRPRMSSEVERVRSREFEACKKELGLSRRSELLHIEEPLVCQVNAELFTRKIREFRPDLVLLPHPDDRHRVHRDVALLTLEALFHSPTLAYAGRRKEWLPYGAYYYETLSGMFGSTISVEGLAISDITDYYAKKVGIMRKAYRTQGRLLKVYTSWIDEMARLRGVAGRCRYGEAFVAETGHVPLKILVG